ncbi:MAG: hypothetical protein U0736_26850 [Gemmataceae bacterium]
MQGNGRLKLIRKEKLGTDAAVRRFYQEAGRRSAAPPQHRPTYDAGPAAAHYFVMEYVDGVDLARLVKDNGLAAGAAGVRVRPASGDRPA